MTVEEMFSFTSNCMRNSRRRQVNPLRLNHVAAICETCLDVLVRQVIVFVHDLLRGPTSCQQIDYEFDGHSSSRYDRLADQHLRIDGNSILPIHTALQFAE